VFVDDKIIFDRKREGRFPEIKELKQLVRNQVNPQKDLGHSDR
jgi:selenoprotein W-related protein